LEHWWQNGKLEIGKAEDKNKRAGQSKWWSTEQSGSSSGSHDLRPTAVFPAGLPTSQPGSPMPRTVLSHLLLLASNRRQSAGLPRQVFHSISIIINSNNHHLSFSTYQQNQPSFDQPIP